MFLEGETNWVMIFGAVAAACVVIALAALAFAVVRGLRHASTSNALDTVQEAAAAAEARLYETLNAVPVALVQTDAKGKFVFANRAAHQLLGRRDAELLGLRFHSATWGITFPDGRPVPADLLPSARALRGQTVKGFQHLMANPATRRKMLVSVTAMPIQTGRGHITGSIAAVVETESLIAPEPAPPAAEPAPETPDDALTRRVFNAASSALVVADAHGRVREANTLALALLDRDGPVEGDFADLFLAADERAAARQALRRALHAQPGETAPIVGGDGVVWRLLPLVDDEGRPDALLLAGERAAVETPPEGAAPPDTAAEDEAADEGPAALELETLRAALTAAEAEAEAARVAVEQTRQDTRTELESMRRLESVGRLTGGLAQDFTALMGVMNSALDLMLKQADDPERVRRIGAAALAAGRKGGELTRRLSAFSQGEDGPPVRETDIAVLLRAMEAPLRALTGPGVDLMVETPARPALARIDPVMFEGAVRALVQNAAEAMGAEGSAAVRLETLEDGELRLSVRDSGPGLEPELARRALEPFFTTRDGAAGLGLSQAYAFARQSGGRLTLDGRPGEGAEAAIHLPAAG